MQVKLTGEHSRICARHEKRTFRWRIALGAIRLVGYDSRMTLVGVISDTHGRLHDAAYAALADCDYIIHAGDIGGPEVLRELKTLAPVSAVLGNNDYAEYGESVGRFARPVVDGVKFLVAHYPRDVVISTLGSGAVVPGGSIPDICIHGHTHVPRLDYGKQARPARFVLNPGSASRPRKGNPRSIAKVEIAEGRIGRIRVETLAGQVLMSVG